MLILGASWENTEGSDYPLSGLPADRQFANHILGPVDYANWLNGGRLRYIKNAGAPSTTSTAQLANIQNAASSQYALGLNPAPGLIYLGHITGDDGGAVAPAQSAANDLTAYKLMRAAYPASIIVLPTLPAVTGNASIRATVNPQRRLLVQQNPNTVLWDCEAEFIDPVTGAAPASISGDAIHPNPAGALALGKALGLVLAPYLPAKSMVNDYVNDARVTAANGGWGTAAAMPGTPGNGVTATGWTFTGPAGATRNLVARSDRYGNWQQMVYGGTAGQMKLTKGAPLAFPQGAVVCSEAEIMFDGNLPAGSITDISLCFFLANASFALIGQTTAMGDTLANRGNYADAGAGTVLTVRTPPIVCPAAVTTNSFLQFAITGTATAGSIRIGRASLIRIS